jgi:hypothetical protein
MNLRSTVAALATAACFMTMAISPAQAVSLAQTRAVPIRQRPTALPGHKCVKCVPRLNHVAVEGSGPATAAPHSIISATTQRHLGNLGDQNQSQQDL